MHALSYRAMDPTTFFTARRPRLQRIAYRMLGSGHLGRDGLASGA